MNVAGIDTRGMVSASVAAKRHRLKLWTLCKAIDAGLIPGAERVQLGRRAFRLVDDQKLAEYIASRPRCAEEGCDKPAGVASDACSGAHARALETRGVKLSAETCRRMSEGKKGKPRPDVRERVHAMHADKKQHAEWGLATMEGRAGSHAIPGTTIRRWKNRRNSLDGGPTRKYNDEQEAWVLALRKQGVGFKRAAQITGLTQKQTRTIFKVANG